MAKKKKQRIEVQWWPQPRQLTFLRACGLAHPFDGGEPGRPVADVIGYGGSAGGGKSDSLLLAGIIAGLTWPGINVGYFRREYPQLEGPGGAIMRSQELMSGWAKWNGTQRRWTLPTGSILQFCHCKDEADVFNYQSQQFDILLFDEATQFLREQVRYLITRNRATKPGIVPFTAMATNPGGIGHSWYKKEFIDPGVVEQPVMVEIEPGQYEKHIFIPAKLADNQILEKRDPGYRRRLENQPEDIRRALLEGDWDVFTGQYFRQFRRDKHSIDPPFMPPPHWRRFASIDWGYAAPCAVLWHAIDPAMGRVITYRELYVTQMQASDLAAKVAEMSKLDNGKYEEISYVKASPDMWQERGLGRNVSEGESIAETIRNVWYKLGFEAHLEPADNRRVMGWTRVREYLKDAPDGLPWWQANSTCTNLLRTLPEMIHDSRNVEDIDGNCEDHAVESLRYGLMSRPVPSSDSAGILAGGFPGYDERRQVSFDEDYDEDDDDDAIKIGFYGR